MVSVNLLKTIALIAAAGQGRRMGAELNKQYLPLLDRPVLAHTLRVFEEHPLIDALVVVVAQDEVKLCQKEVVQAFGFNKVLKIVVGGAERQDSVYQGLISLPEECEMVVVHDGARPLITPQIISDVIKDAQSSKASLVAVPVKDTIKKVDPEGYVAETLKREELFSAQTPQVFSKDLLLWAYRKALAQGVIATDDASLVERLGVRVGVVLGSYENIKLTTPEDLELALGFLRRRNSCE